MKRSVEVVLAKQGFFRLAVIFIMFGCTSALAQTQTQTRVSGVTVSYGIGTLNVRGPGISLYPLNITVGASYPIDVDQNSYLSDSRFKAIVQALAATYANGVPIEAVLSSVLSSIMDTYPQISAGTLTANYTNGTGASTTASVINVVRIRPPPDPPIDPPIDPPAAQSRSSKNTQ